MSALRILIVDDEPAARFALKKALSQPGYELMEASDGRAALAALREQAPDLAFLDLSMPEMSGQEVLRELAGQGRAEIVVLTANDNVAAAVECMRLGAADYISKPYEVEQVRAIARRVANRLALERRVGDLERALDGRFACGALVGASPAMRELFGHMNKAAAAEIDVLIQGETGTGKELIAREIHNQSARAAGPFVAVNAAAIAESLAESELFGHVKGAFTGAAADRRGAFEQASGGTLFLDEIGDMPLPAQAKILRALQERAVRRVGGDATIEVDVRVVSATHQDLPGAIRDGHFRADLYYRLRGLELRVPPLRSRREDILLLASHFLERPGASGARKQLAPCAVDRLLAHAWPGNVRELEQVLAAAAALTEGETLRAADLAIAGQTAPADAPAIDLASLRMLPLTEAKAQLVEAYERQAIAEALKEHDGNVSAAARQLGVHRQNLQQKMTQYGLTR